MVFNVTSALLVTIMPLACRGNVPSDGSKGKNMQGNSKTIEKVLSEHTDEWMSIPGVTGVGVGKCGDELCIRVFVTRDPDAIRKKIPEETDGYIVDIVLTGGFRARDSLDRG